MYKNILFSVLLCLLSKESLMAQCGNTHLHEEKHYNPQNLRTTSTCYPEDNNSYCLDMIVHIVKEANGKPIIEGTSQQVKDFEDTLNSSLNPYGISIRLIGITLIDDHNLAIINGSNEVDYLFQNYKYPHAMNAFIVDKLYNFGDYDSVAGVAEIGSNGFAIVKDELHSSVGAHELGHCLGLYHTFKYDDFVCDTPPDTEEGSSSNNIMSYSSNPSVFTNDQKNRMKNYLTHHSGLINVVNNSNAYRYRTLYSTVWYDYIVTEHADDLVVKSTIYPTAYANYTGTSIKLSTGFYAKLGSQVHAFPGGCTDQNPNSKIAIFEDGEENNNSIIELFPNPSNGNLTINLPSNSIEDTYDVRVVNLSGMVLYNIKLNSGENSIDLSFLPKGAYILSAKNSTELYNSKLIIE